MPETPTVPPPRRPARGAAVPPPPPRRVRAVLAVAALLVLVGMARFVWQVHEFRDRRATGPAWSFPSRVWSDGLLLAEGAPLPVRRLREHLEMRGYRNVASRAPRPGEWVERGGRFELGLRGSLEARDPDGGGGPEHVRVELSGGRIARVERRGGYRGQPPPDTAHAPRLEPLLLASIADSNGITRTWTPLERIPRALQDAVVAAEDRRFRSHFGVDLRGNARALAANVRAGGVREGASTITQQLARGWFLGPERTVLRKALEVVLAVGIELALSKDEILEAYLNSVYFGRDAYGGVAGVGAASQRFFGLPVEQLDLPRAALLAGVIPAPNLYSPVRRPERARERRAAVLRDMLAVGAIDPATARAAAEAPLGLAPLPPERERFPSAVGAAMQELGSQLPREALAGWGLEVFTTIDPVSQRNAEREFEAAMRAQRADRRRAPLQGAFVLLENTSGRVRATVGGRDMHATGFHRALQARRQPGSAFKPFVYAAALDPSRGGERFTLATRVLDEPRTFRTPSGPWSPKNSDGRYRGPVTLTQALAQSLNLATADVVDRIGPEAVARTAERFGLGRPPAYLSIGLGTHEVTPLALAAAYAVFGDEGRWHEPYVVRAVHDGRGRASRLRTRRTTTVLTPAATSLMVGLLQEVVRHGTASALQWSYALRQPLGGKTGTTNDAFDTWFVGVTPVVTAAVWVGYDQPASLAGSSTRVAVPVWGRIMRAEFEGQPRSDWPEPEGIEHRLVDLATGERARGDCPFASDIPFLAGTAPSAVCAADHTVDWARLRTDALIDSLTQALGDSAAAAADSVF